MEEIKKLIGELERLAKAATPGEWRCKEGTTPYPESDDSDYWAVVLSPAGREIVTLYERSSLDDRSAYDADAAFIATANPANILKLTAALTELEGERDRLRVSLKELFPANICTGNPLIPDTMVMPCDVTMGELRRAHAALTPPDAIGGE